MESFLPFFLLLLAGAVFASVFARLHVPWVVALIVAGIVIGPYSLDLIELNPTIEFLAELGLIFLMFMAGLETKLESFRVLGRRVVLIALINGGIPFLVGVAIATLFGFGLMASLLIGVIFVSSSIAVVIPSLTASGLFHKRIGHTIVAATILADVTSLILLSILLQSADPTTALPLWAFYPLLIGVLLAMRFLLPRIEHLLALGRKTGELFQQELRAVFTVLVGTVIVFELMGLHPIIGGFFAGLVLSDSITDEILIEKLRAISYGIFIPTFFIVVGVKTDISVFLALGSGLLLTVVLVASSVLAKLGSGYLAGIVTGFSKRESALIGTATIPQLSTTLAVVFAAVGLELVPSELAAAMVVLSVVTTFIGPIGVRAIAAKMTPPESAVSARDKALVS